MQPTTHRHSKCIRHAYTRRVCSLVLTLFTTLAGAQTTTAADTQRLNSFERVAGIPSVGALQWNDLRTDQKSALLPLKSSWNELSDIQKRKWLTITSNFSTLSQEDKEKIQARMEDWATLKPAQRERARENFASSKTHAPSGRADSWEEYLSLPIEEREKLAAQVQRKKSGAAKNKPSTPRSTAGASPKNLAESEPAAKDYRMKGNLRDWVHPNTLLPRDGGY